MADRKFKRAVKVIGHPPRPSASSPFGAYLDDNVPALEVQDLRVQFNIEKHLGSEPNTFDVTITNLSESSRGFFEQRPFHVQLQAGYGDDLHHLCRGDVRFAQSVRRETDWETSLQVADGDRAYRHARVNRSFGAGVTLETALREVVASMGGELPASSLTLARALATQQANGLTLYGSSSTALTRLLAPHGLTWSIQDGQIVILRDDEVRVGFATVISQDTGMIGFPEFGPPDRPAARAAGVHRSTTKKVTTKSLKHGLPALTVKMLLAPHVTPGILVQVESSRIQGTFKVLRVTHQGDTHGDDWTTEIEAVAA